MLYAAWQGRCIGNSAFLFCETVGAERGKTRRSHARNLRSGSTPSVQLTSSDLSDGQLGIFLFDAAPYIRGSVNELHVSSKILHNALVQYVY
jgi:hypothetical protein